MSQQKIEKLTLEQEALIPVYRDKWRSIALSTEPCDSQRACFASREKAMDAIDSAYIAIGLYKPRLIFFDSPYTGLGKLDKQLENLFQKGVSTLLHKQWNKQCIWQGESWEQSLIRGLWNGLERELKRQVEGELYRQLDELLSRPLARQLRAIEHQLYRQMESQLYSSAELKLLEQINRPETNIYTDITPLADLFQILVKSEILACYGSLYDFCISVLNCDCDRSKWEAYQALVKNCGWFVPFKNICLVGDRPRLLSFDDRGRLHAFMRSRNSVCRRI